MPATVYAFPTSILEPRQLELVKPCSRCNRTARFWVRGNAEPVHACDEHLSLVVDETPYFDSVAVGRYQR